MILIDYSNIAHAVISHHLYVDADGQQQQPDEDFLRHMILNSLRSNRQKFKSYGEFVVCQDSLEVRSWRKEVSPYYKSHRAKARSESAVDWKLIYQSINKFPKEIEENLGWLVVNFYSCEADDVIAALAKRSTDEKNIIVSNDGDFIQLLSIPGVNLYSPTKKEFVKPEGDPRKLLVEKILENK